MQLVAPLSECSHLASLTFPLVANVVATVILLELCHGRISFLMNEAPCFFSRRKGQGNIYFKRHVCMLDFYR